MAGMSKVNPNADTNDFHGSAVSQHNSDDLLQAAIVEKFLSFFVSDAAVLYQAKGAGLGNGLCRELPRPLAALQIENGRFPAVIAYSEQRNRLFLVEAVRDHIPIGEARLKELQSLTRECHADVVFVSAFLERSAFANTEAEVAWGTVVWFADEPGHMVHFDKFGSAGIQPKFI